MPGLKQSPQWFRVQAIGYVERPHAREPDPDAFYDPWLETALHILPRWADALEGIEEYSHLVVVWCTQLQRSRLAVVRSG